MKFHPTIAAIALATGIATLGSTLVMADPLKSERNQHHCSAGEHRMQREAGMPAEHLPPYLRGIELTDAQRDQIFDLTYKQMPAQRELGKQLRQIHEQLHTLALGKDYDSAKAKQLVDSQSKLQGQMMLSRIETDHQIYQLLTDEQRKQLEERKPRAR